MGSEALALTLPPCPAAASPPVFEVLFPSSFPDFFSKTHGTRTCKQSFVVQSARRTFLMRFFKTFHLFFPLLPAFPDRKLLECDVSMPTSKGSTLCFPKAGVNVPRVSGWFQGQCVCWQPRGGLRACRPVRSGCRWGRGGVLRGGGDKGRVQKQLGRILVGLLHRWGMSTSETTLRGNGVEHGYSDLWWRDTWRALWAGAGRSVWSPQWEVVTISIVSVVNCQLGTLKSLPLGILIGPVFHTHEAKALDLPGCFQV